jgi:hypothetical protein
VPAPAPRQPPAPPTQTLLAALPALAWGSRPRSTPARTALLGGGVAAVLAISLLVGVRLDVGGQPAGADSTAAPVAPTKVTQGKSPAKPTRTGAPHARSTKKRRAGAGRPSAPSAPSHRRFAWAPTDGASGYDVEFFRDGARVYVGHTSQPAIDVPGTWRYDGAAHSFHAGEYSWYVWPEVAGRRSARASVQTTISIAHG